MRGTLRLISGAAYSLQPAPARRLGLKTQMGRIETSRDVTARRWDGIQRSVPLMGAKGIGYSCGSAREYRNVRFGNHSLHY